MKIHWELINNNTHIYLKNVDFIKHSFYQNYRFYVLPYLPTKFRDRVVFFPRTNSKLFSNTEDKTNLQVQNLSKKLESTAVKYSKYYTTKYASFISISEKLNESFYEFVYNNLQRTPIINIHVSPVYFGSLGSYEFCNDNLYVYPRFDRSLSQIYALMVTGLVHAAIFPNKSPLSENEWSIKQKKSFEIYSSNIFKRVYGEVESLNIILQTRKVGQLALDSYNYLAELGYPIKPYITNITNIKNLTSTETKVLTELYTHKPSIVTFDKIAEIMWECEADSNYSLYAISKLIERLNAKIRTSGIRQNIIHVERGKGYLLYD